MFYSQNYNLINNNSFRLKSQANEIWFPKNLFELKEVLARLKYKKFFLLAGGTNVLLAPKIKSVISLKYMPKRLCLGDKKREIIVSANYSTARFVNKLIRFSIRGFEGLYGIPGTIGGAVVMNAGSGKYAISDYISEVETIDYKGCYHFYSKKSLKFARRYSLLQDKKEVIINVKFIVPTGKVNQSELNKAIEHRKTIPHYPSAGGIWKNWHTLKPYANELIGLRVGDAEVSKSVNIIVNRGNASFDDIIILVNKIGKIVKESLEMEVKIIGK